MGVSWVSAAIGKTLGGMFHKVETKLLTTSPSQRQFQWGGGINDAGTMVWTTPANPSSPVWYVFAGSWSKEIKCVTSNQNSVTDVLTHECYRCSDCALRPSDFSL
jgi:hypothetical protein